MTIDRKLLVAFGGAGTLWVLGLTVFVFLFNVLLAPMVAAYFLIFAVAVASKRLATTATLLAAWAVAVLAGVVMMYSADEEMGSVLLLGGVLGTFLFGGWVVTSFLLLLLIDPERRKITI